MFIKAVVVACILVTLPEALASEYNDKEHGDDHCLLQNSIRGSNTKYNATFKASMDGGPRKCYTPVTKREISVCCDRRCPDHTETHNWPNDVMFWPKGNNVHSDGVSDIKYKLTPMDDYNKVSNKAIKKGQPFYQELDGTIESDGQAKLTVHAGRKDDKDVAVFFNDGLNSQQKWIPDLDNSPSVLHFAFIGELSMVVGGCSVVFPDFRIAQGVDHSWASHDNVWFLGSAHCARDGKDFVCPSSSGGSLRFLPYDGMGVGVSGADHFWVEIEDKPDGC